MKSGDIYLAIYYAIFWRNKWRDKFSKIKGLIFNQSQIVCYD